MCRLTTQQPKDPLPSLLTPGEGITKGLEVGLSCGSDMRWLPGWRQLQRIHLPMQRTQGMQVPCRKTPCRRKWRALQYPRREHPVVRGGWWATVPGSQSSRAQLRAGARRAASGHGAPGPLPSQGPALTCLLTASRFLSERKLHFKTLQRQTAHHVDEVGILLRQRKGGSSSPQPGHTPHL